MATNAAGVGVALLITHERRHLVQAQRLLQAPGFPRGSADHLRWSPRADAAHQYLPREL